MAQPEAMQKQDAGLRIGCAGFGESRPIGGNKIANPGAGFSAS